MSVFNGPAPTVNELKTPEAETRAVGDWIKAQVDGGLAAHEIGVFVRSEAELDRARQALQQAGFPS